MDATQTTQLRKELFEEPDKPVLMFIGRLTSQKKVHMLFEAVATLKRQGKPANILIIGDGPERERLAKAAEEFGILDAVCFYGPCFDESTNAKLIYMADICVAPGEVGLTAMHAMANGTPVITHDERTKQMPEFEAVIEGKSGSFFREGDCNSLANTIGAWMSSRPDRQKVRDDCRATIHRYFLSLIHI